MIEKRGRSDIPEKQRTWVPGSSRGDALHKDQEKEGRQIKGVAVGK